MTEDQLHRQRERKKTPSPDRVDSKIRYVIDNIRWVTHSENSANIAADRRYRRVPADGSRNI
jgi:hypothetical protein